jgi:hypothetical protein
MLKGRLSGFVFQFLAFVLALAFVSLILIAAKASPMEAFKNIWRSPKFWR